MVGSKKLAVVNWEDRIVRLFDDTDAARQAVQDWQEHDRRYMAGNVPDAEYLTFGEFMEQAGIPRYQTSTITL